MRLLELFDNPVDVRWLRNESDHVEGEWYIGMTQYRIDIREDGETEGHYVVIFGVDDGEQMHYDNTNTGNQYLVYSTVFQCMREFASTRQVGGFVFEANDKGRQSLYRRFVQKFLPKWSLRDYGNVIVIEPPGAAGDSNPQ